MKKHLITDQEWAYIQKSRRHAKAWAEIKKDRERLNARPGRPKNYEEWKRNQGAGRTYLDGRSTLGWCKGQKVTKYSTLKPGMLLIMVSHQFQADNLIKITPPPALRIDSDVCYYVYAKPDGKPTGESAMALWKHEVEGPWQTKAGPREFFLAKKSRK